MLLELLLIVCSEISMASKEWFNKISKLCKSSQYFDKEAVLRWSVLRVKFLLIVSLLKSLKS